MPIGVITNVLSVVIGGLLGGLIGNRISDSFKTHLNTIFGICAMGMGISAIGQMQYMPAVIFSVIVGTGLSLALHLGEKINRAGAGMQRLILRAIPAKNSGLSQEEFQSMLLTVIVLFCASGTGIYGSLDSGMTGDHTILISKSVLDLFTALIFACSLGYVVCVIALPQLVIFLALFFAARLIFPLTTPAMIGDFKACGGFLLLATGFRMMRVKETPLADMIPAMVLVMPVSYLWASWLMPLIQP